MPYGTFSVLTLYFNFGGDQYPLSFTHTVKNKGRMQNPQNDL